MGQEVKRTEILPNQKAKFPLMVYEIESLIASLPDRQFAPWLKEPDLSYLRWGPGKTCILFYEYSYYWVKGK
ncbi:unnamed protein product [Cochlearia groenlandica]